MFIDNLLLVLINGKPRGYFQATRGIRQDVPLSPFLFLLTTEALSRLLTKEESVGNVQGIEMARGGSLFHSSPAR